MYGIGGIQFSLNYVYFISIATCIDNFDGEERAGCFALFVFLVSCDCCVTLPRGATELSAVCECGIS